MIVRFKVKYWDSDEKVVQTEGGITEAESLGGAVDKIADSIEEEIIEVSVYECDDIIYDFDLEDFLKESNT